MNEISDGKQLNSEAKLEAIEMARDKTNVAKWGLNSVIFLFALLIVIIILASQEMGIYFIAIVAILGLATAWVTGWRRGKQLLQRFYLVSNSLIGNYRLLRVQLTAILISKLRLNLVLV